MASLDDDSDLPPISTLLTCSFNQDGGCLALGTNHGFSVYNLHPTFGLSVQRDLGGGIGLVEMLFRCNLMAVVGGGPSPKAPPHRVLVWDDHLAKSIGELSFRQVVLSVRLRKDAIAVALRDRVYVYHLADLSLRDKIYTADNPHGLLCLSTQIQDMVLACPSVTTGHVRVELYGLRKTVLMEAHESSLRALALTADGTKLATASNKGTLIRVWDVASATCLQEFRRGVERASITCLAWSWNAQWLACSSDKGTTHIFSLRSNHEADHSATSTTASSHNNKEPTSYTQMFLAGVRKSVEGDSKKSSYQVRGLPHPQACAFVAEASNILAVAGWDADGNGVLMMVEFNGDSSVVRTDSAAAGAVSNSHDCEPRRIGYHVLCRSNISRDESDEARRRRRLRGWTPEIPETPEGGRLYIGERLEVLEQGMETIHFEETDEFVSVTAIQPSEPEQQDDDKAITETAELPLDTNQEGDGSNDSIKPLSPGPMIGSDTAGQEDVPSPTSIRTESLEDEDVDEDEQEETHLDDT